LETSGNVKRDGYTEMKPGGTVDTSSGNETGYMDMVINQHTGREEKGTVVVVMVTIQTKTKFMLIVVQCHSSINKRMRCYRVLAVVNFYMICYFYEKIECLSLK